MRCYRTRQDWSQSTDEIWRLYKTYIAAQHNVNGGEYEYLYTNGKSSYKSLKPEYEKVSNPRPSREMKNKDI